MGSGLITVFLPIALAIIMAGLGLELTINDFKTRATTPKSRVYRIILPTGYFSRYCIYYL